MSKPLSFGLLLFWTALLPSACSSSKQEGGIRVNLDPATAIVQTGGVLTFVAVVSGSTDPAMQWTVQEAAAGGTITSVGVYTAPAQPGTFHVVATAHVDATKFATAAVTVTQGTPPSLAISPRNSSMVTNATQQFTAQFTGTGGSSVTWAVVEGGAGGLMSGSGLYTAPTVAGSYHVTATSPDNASLRDTAAITVSGPASGSPGVWQNVTPSPVNLDKDYAGAAQNYGVQDILVDPARPSDVYAFICYQGVWKSTDYGATFRKASTDGNLEKGRPWGEAIDPNPNRNPGVAPVMYAAQGYGPDNGIWKSADGGVSWTQVYIDPGSYGRDIYTIDIDPHDASHLLAAFHNSNKLVESHDAGHSWLGRGAMGNVGGGGVSISFLDSTTWLAVSQWNNNTNGTWRTTNSGGQWTQVNSNEHFHGANQVLVQPGNVLYEPGYPDGVLRSSDLGANWTSVTDSGRYANSIVATATYLYAADSFATNGTYDPKLQRRSATAGAGTNFSSYLSATPIGMTNGPKRVATTFDGSRWVIISGNWLAGIWRYVEN